MTSNIHNFGADLAKAGRSFGRAFKAARKAIVMNTVILWVGSHDHRKVAGLDIADPYAVSDGFHKAVTALAKSKLPKGYANVPELKRAADNIGNYVKEGREFARFLKDNTRLPNENEMANLVAWYDATRKAISEVKEANAAQEAALAEVARAAEAGKGEAPPVTLSAPSAGTNVTLADVLAFIGMTDNADVLRQMANAITSRNAALEAMADDAAREGRKTA